MPWFESSAVRAWRTGLSGFGVWSSRVNTSFGTPGGTWSIKMTTEEKDKVSIGNQLPIDMDKLKEEHKAELKAATEANE